MKRNLQIAAGLVALAGVAIVLVVILPFWNRDDAENKTIKPKPEPILALPKQEPKTEPIKKEPIQVAVAKKTAETEKPVPKKVEPEPKRTQDLKELSKKGEPPEVKKAEPKEIDKKPDYSKVLVFGDTIRLRDPDGEYTLKALVKGQKVIVLGSIKTLKVAGVNNRSTLDTTELTAESIIFLASIHSASQVKLGKVKKLKVQSLDSGSLLDASASAAEEIAIAGNINGGSRALLSAPDGKIFLAGEINGGAKVEVVAPGARFRLKSSHATIVNGDSTLSVLAKDVELLGSIDGTRTQVSVTLSKAGSLKFMQISGGSRLHYRKSAAADPAPRIDAGRVGSKAQFRQIPPR